jgi:hypothetical protein
VNKKENKKELEEANDFWKMKQLSNKCLRTNVLTPMNQSDEKGTMREWLQHWMNERQSVGK